MEGSEGLRWSEGERSDGCRWAAASWLGDMVEGLADELGVLLCAHCWLAAVRAALVLRSGGLLLLLRKCSMVSSSMVG